MYDIAHCELKERMHNFITITTFSSHMYLVVKRIKVGVLGGRGLWLAPMQSSLARNLVELP